MGQSELHWNDPAPNVKDTGSIGIDGLLNLRSISRNYVQDHVSSLG